MRKIGIALIILSIALLSLSSFAFAENKPVEMPEVVGSHDFHFINVLNFHLLVSLRNNPSQNFKYA